jgi:hypothetical protein
MHLALFPSLCLRYFSDLLTMLVTCLLLSHTRPAPAEHVTCSPMFRISSGSAEAPQPLGSEPIAALTQGALFAAIASVED